MPSSSPVHHHDSLGPASALTMWMVLQTIRDQATSMYPDHPAVRMDDHVLTYAVLDDAASRMVTLLRGSGLEPGAVSG